MHIFECTLQTQRTNDSSIVSKNSASICHYFEDNFLKHFVTKPSKGRSPLINRFAHKSFTVLLQTT